MRLAVDLGRELRERVEPRLLGPPVEAVGPVGRELAGVATSGRRGSSRSPRRPASACCAQARPQVVERRRSGTATVNGRDVHGSNSSIRLPVGSIKADDRCESIEAKRQRLDRLVAILRLAGRIAGEALQVARQVSLIRVAKVVRHVEDRLAALEASRRPPGSNDRSGSGSRSAR